MPRRAVNRALFCKVQRRDFDPLPRDVTPDVELGPIRKRKYPQTFSGMHVCIIQAPKLRPLRRGSHLCCAVRKETIRFRAALFLIAASAAECGVKPMLFERLTQAIGLHDLCISCAMGEWINSLRQ